MRGYALAHADAAFGGIARKAGDTRGYALVDAFEGTPLRGRTRLCADAR
jgi:hypothetical protein